MMNERRFRRIVRALRKIIEDALGEERRSNLAEDIQFSYGLDHADEPGIWVSITMKERKYVPNVREDMDLTRKLRVFLDEFGDRSFPYVYFHALDDTPSRRDANTSKALPETSELP